MFKRKCSMFNARFIRKCLQCTAIKKSKKELRSVRKDAAICEKDLAKVLSSIDKCILDNAIKKNVCKCAVKFIKKHEKRLRNLTKKSHYSLQVLKLSIICLVLP